MLGTTTLILFLRKYRNWLETQIDECSKHENSSTLLTFLSINGFIDEKAIKEFVKRSD